MKNKYPFQNIKASFLLAFVGISGALTSQISYTFTPCGATGSVGPTQAQVNSAYASTNLSGLVAVTGSGIQNFTVPVSGPYRIKATGAQGGYNGGYGASISGDFTLTAGTVLKIVVGQKGIQANNGTFNSGGGGGGSFVSNNANLPYVVAGGGGGNGDGYGGSPPACCLSGMQGVITLTGSPNNNGSNNGSTSGNGAGCGTSGSGAVAGGGGGFFTDGSLCQAGSVGQAFINGALGGSPGGFPATGAGIGGFGGGGGCYNSGTGNRGGGGGGYSGGGGGDTPTFAEANAPGGGGGSYNGGTNQTNLVGSTLGDGKVVIDQLCNMSLSAATSASSGITSGFALCAGATLTLTTNGASNYSWSTGNTTNSVIVVSPTVTTTYTVSATTTAACTGYGAITVTVSGGLPSMTINASSTNTCLGTSITLTATGALNYTWTGGVSNGVAFTPTASTGYTVTGQNGCGTSTASTFITLNPLPVTASTATTTICAGYPTTLNASSSGNYAYTWLPGTLSGSAVVVSPSVTTIYTVTASNGVCQGVANLTLNAIPLPTVTSAASSTNVCAGTSVTLTASGGQSYNWTPGNLPGTSIVITPTAPVQYSVSATNSQGCLAGSTQIIVVAASPNLNLTVSDYTVCAGGSSNLYASGANSYTWSNGVSGASITVTPPATGMFYVTGVNSSNTCVATQSVTINVFSPSVTVNSSPTTICSGQTVSLTASGATNYTWLPSSSGPVITDTPTTTTTYTVNASTSSGPGGINCPSSNTIQVTVNPLPNVTVVSTRTNICKGETTDLTASGATSYSWTNSSSTSAAITVSSNVVTTLLYTVTGTNAQGCSASAEIQVKVNGCNGIAENAYSESVLVYPNPSNGEFMITNAGEIEFSLINQVGQVVQLIKLDQSNNYKANVKGLANGIYFIVGQNKEHLINSKIVVNR